MHRSFAEKLINSLRPRRNRRHFADDIFKCTFLNENVLNSIKISPQFIPTGPINNSPVSVQITVWRRPGDKPISKPMMIILLTHICVTRPQRVKLYLTCRLQQSFRCGTFRNSYPYRTQYSIMIALDIAVQNNILWETKSSDFKSAV